MQVLPTTPLLIDHYTGDPPPVNKPPFWTYKSRWWSCHEHDFDQFLNGGCYIYRRDRRYNNLLEVEVWLVKLPNYRFLSIIYRYLGSYIYIKSEHYSLHKYSPALPFHIRLYVVKLQVCEPIIQCLLFIFLCADDGGSDVQEEWIWVSNVPFPAAAGKKTR